MTDRSYEYDPQIRTVTETGRSSVQAPKATPTPPKRPGRVAIIVGVVMIGAAVVLFIVSIVAVLVTAFDLPEAGFNAPGSATIVLSEGENSIWLERSDRAPDRTSLSCTVESLSRGSVEVRAAGSSTSVTINDRRSVLLFEFTTSASGPHEVDCRGDSGRVLVGQYGDVTPFALAGALSFPVGFVGAIVLLVGIITKMRGRAA